MKPFSYLSLFCAAAGATQIPLSVETEPPVLPPAFLDYVAEVVANNTIPGLTLGVVRLDEVQRPAYQHVAWGRRTEDAEVDMTTDILFGIASCSKAYTAAALGILMDDFAQGRNVTHLPGNLARFDWDTKIAAVLPGEWELQDETATRIATFRDALSHVTGLPRHDYTYRPEDTTHDVLMRQRNLRSAYELREKWSYNNQMYVLAAHVIAKYSNTTFQDFVETRLFRPLNMSSSTYQPSEAHATGRLTQAWTPVGDSVRRIPFWFSDQAARMNAGPGGVTSSVEDSTNWLAMWLNKGVDPVSGRTIIPSDVYETATTARTVVYGSPTPGYGPSIVGYAAGWMRWSFQGIEVVQHSGGIPGFSSLTMFSPSHNLGVVIMANRDGAYPAALDIAKRLFETVLGLDALVIPAPSSQRADADIEGAPTSLPLDAYAGTYAAPGYGALTLCAPSGTSHHCARVLSDFAALGEPIDDALLGEYRSMWSTHARLRHRARDAFTLTFTALFPRGYGRNASAFETFERGESEGRAEFVVEGGVVRGFGLVIDEEAVEARARNFGGGVEERADAWFAKV